MKKESIEYNAMKRILSFLLIFLLAVILGCAASGGGKGGSSRAAVAPPMEIPENVTCGKCSMYPARYPRWQSQIIFKDKTMTPFDGCKCMFNFMFAMSEYDKMHTRADMSVAWVKDFNSGAWINAEDAYYVVGSNMMGPMGKELIPFADHAAAKEFHQEQGGEIMKYADITPDVMKTLGMGGMKMKPGAKHMDM